MGGYIGARAGTISATVANVDKVNAQDVTATDTTPEVTIVNTTHEDTDGGREGKVIFKGQQSGGEESTLAEIEAHHHGSSDDEKGSLVFRTNDGSDGASPTEAMRIDSSQNVGIGCVPNSIQSGFDTLQIGGNLTLNVDSTGAGAGVYMGNNVYRDSGNSRWEYSYTDEASQYLQAGGEHIWRYAASGTADTAITWSEAMRIDNSGNVGIGTSSPSEQINLVGSGGTSKIRFDGDSSNLQNNFIGITGYDDLIIASDEANSATASTIQFRVDATERMRINSSGYLGIGRTDPVQRLDVSAGTANQWACRLRHDGFGGTNYFLQFDHNGGVIGSVTGNGSSVTYATSSDYRLKENVTNVTDGITRVKQLAPKRFNFIADADKTVDGFLAHEAQTVVPEAITGTKDEVEVWADGDELPDGVSVGDNKLDDDGNTIPVMQGIDQAKLVPLLTAALQEAIAKIETLETKVAALEAG